MPKFSGTKKLDISKLDSFNIAYIKNLLQRNKKFRPKTAKKVT
jgi:hypothetical protein